MEITLTLQLWTLVVVVVVVFSGVCERVSECVHVRQREWISGKSIIMGARACSPILYYRVHHYSPTEWDRRHFDAGPPARSAPPLCLQEHSSSRFFPFFFLFLQAVTTEAGDEPSSMTGVRGKDL